MRISLLILNGPVCYCGSLVLKRSLSLSLRGSRDLREAREGDKGIKMAPDLSFQLFAPSLRVCMLQEVELQIRTSNCTWDGCRARQLASCSTLTYTDCHLPFNTTPSLLSFFYFLICHFYTLSSLQPRFFFSSVTFNQSLCRFDCVCSLCVCSPIKHNSSIKEGKKTVLCERMS